VDGRLTQTFSDKAQIPNKPMYLLLNLAVGGSWPGDPDASTVFPAEMLVDYVRVWQRA
jgi:beta-glucanase (GH16 family)